MKKIEFPEIEKIRTVSYVHYILPGGRKHWSPMSGTDNFLNGAVSKEKPIGILIKTDDMMLQNPFYGTFEKVVAEGDAYNIVIRSLYNSRETMELPIDDIHGWFYVYDGDQIWMPKSSSQQCAE